MAYGTDKMSKHRFNSTILRAYDIRGIYQDTLTESDAYAIGMSFVACLRQRGHGTRIAVGRDGRLSSPTLAEALIKGLTVAGGKVLDIGCGPTPMLYFAGIKLNCDGAIQVTGSHNPSTHNGFKMVMNGKSFFGDDIQWLSKVSADGVAHVNGGECTLTAVFDDYIKRLLQTADAGNLSVVWDCGNGATGPATVAIVKQLTGKHKILFADIDGTFPNHHPNPVDPETLALLQAEVSVCKADIGISFDGDGDRIGIVDSRGRQIPGDLLTAYLAQDIIARNPAAPVILDVKSSDMAMSLISQAGGNAQMWKTGHSHMKKRMAEIDAPIAGEMSGHIFIADNYFGFDDALYVAIRVLSQMLQTGQSITDFNDTLPKQYATPELHIECDDTKKFLVVDRLSAYVKTIYNTNDVTLIDGVRVRTKEGWWLVRASNTEAALVVRAEGHNVKALNILIKNIETALAASGLIWHASSRLESQ